MSSLYGEYSYVMDAKGRVFVPARFRDELHKEDKNYFMLSIGLDRCLYIFLPSKWEELIANNMEIFKSENKEEERAFKRYFFGNAADAQDCVQEAYTRAWQHWSRVRQARPAKGLKQRVNWVPGALGWARWGPARRRRKFWWR